MKSTALALVATTAIAFTGIGCGGSGGENTASDGSRMTLQGTVSASEVSLDNARAIALSADGHAYAAYLDSHGDFSLDVPIGHAYRVVVANSLASGRHAVVAHLAIRTSRGTSTWLGARTGGTIDLGVLSSASQGGKLVPACGCTGGDGGTTTGGGGGDGHGGGEHHDDGNGGYQGGATGGYTSSGDGHHAGDHSDDDKCKQDDGEHSKVCSTRGSYEVELEPTHDPGDKCDDKDLDDDQEKKGDDSYGDCNAPSGGSGEGSGGGGYAGGSTGGAGGGYGTGGTTPPTGRCATNADCGSGTCVACTCTSGGTTP